MRKKTASQRTPGSASSRQVQRDPISAASCSGKGRVAASGCTRCCLYCPSAGLELRPGLVPVALALDAQLQQLLVERELVRADDGARETLRDQAALDQRLRRDRVLRRSRPDVV